MSEETKRQVNYTLTLIFMWILVSVFSPIGVFGKLEGYFFPVMSNIEIEIEKVEGVETHFIAYAQKYRNCGFDSLEWRIGGKNGTKVKVNFLEGEKIRPEGDLLLGPWSIFSTKEIILDDSYVEATHKCHPFWKTTTVIYDKGES